MVMEDVTFLCVIYVDDPNMEKEMLLFSPLLSFHPLLPGRA